MSTCTVAMPDLRLQKQHTSFGRTRNSVPFVMFYNIVAVTLLVASGRAVKIGLLYDGSVVDQIDRGLVKRAMITAPSSPEGLDDHQKTTNVQLLWRQLNASNAVLALEEVCGLVEAGIQGLVSALSCRSRGIVSSQAERFQLPHVSVSTEACDQSAPSRYTLHLNEQFSQRTKLLTDVLGEMGWTSAALLFDDSIGPVQRKGLVLALSANMIESSISMFNTKTAANEDIAEALLRLTSRKTDVVIVMARSLHLAWVLSQGKQLGLLGPSFYWILLCDDLIPSDAKTIFSSHIESNILLIRQSWSGTSPCQDVNCGLENCLKDTVCTHVCPYMTRLEATLADAVSLFAQSSRSTHLQDNVDRHDTLMPAETASSLNMTRPLHGAHSVVSCLGSANLTTRQGDVVMDTMRAASLTGYATRGGFNSNGFSETVHFELYSLENSSNDPLHLVGTWNSQHGLTTIHENRLFLNKFYDFGGRVLTIATLESHPFSLPTTVNNVTTYSGFAFDILNELTVRLKFSYRIVEPPDRLYGAPNPDGTWNGMVGMVKRGEIDMAVGPFTITSIRESVIDFTKPYLEDSSGILTRKPQEEDSQIFQMFKPYSGEVWGAIAAATFFVGIISYLVNYHTPYSGIRQGLRESTSDEIDFKENLWLIYSSAMEQGATYHPNATSGRLVLGFFWIFTIVVVATYTANLAAFLTVAVPFTPINSLGELLAQSEVQPVVKDGTNLWAMFQSSKRGIYQDVWSRLQQSPRATVTEDALELVEQGQYAYISDNALLQYIALSGCKFAVANEVFNTAGYGFVMPENAPFQDAVNYNIMKMQEAGLIEKWRQKWWSSDGTKCSSEERTGSAISLSLGNLGGAFLVYLIVAGVSIVCLSLEIIGKSTGLFEKLRRKLKRPLEIKSNGFHQNGLS